MSIIAPPGVVFGYEEIAAQVDERTLQILERRRKTAVVRRRGWLVRRMLLAADVVGLTFAFLVTELLVAGATGHSAPDWRAWLFVLVLPTWMIAAKLSGLYDRDEERADHTTADDIVRVFQLVTLGVWLCLVGGWVTSTLTDETSRLIAFWALAVASVTFARIVARTLCRRSLVYLQNTVIVGAGEIGQLVGRKLLQHPEYGVNLVGFVDADPKEQRADIEHLRVIGEPSQLPAIVRLFDIERVIVAFSGADHAESIALVRSLRDSDVQIDLVPRLFELIGPNVSIHGVEGLPLLGLPQARISRSSRLLKRTLDVAGASIALLLAAPLLAFVAIRIKLDSPGPVLFRQTRLGLGRREFTLLKFRSMRSDTDDAAHRDYVRALMAEPTAPTANGLYKLDRSDAVTRVGAWLRRTSLDELPQLLNVLRGEMSLVGPRPCIPYELEHLAPHHFDRFLVPAGLTGLWQVTARAHTTFAEALEMDVAYARGWSLGLDVALLLRTIKHVLGGGNTA